MMMNYISACNISLITEQVSVPQMTVLRNQNVLKVYFIFINKQVIILYNVQNCIYMFNNVHFN
jgi:hypothetical protein